MLLVFILVLGDKIARFLNIWLTSFYTNLLVRPSISILVSLLIVYFQNFWNTCKWSELKYLYSQWLDKVHIIIYRDSKFLLLDSYIFLLFYDYFK